MAQRWSREESERTEESVTSTSCNGGGGEVEGEELKRQRTEEDREGEDEEVESESGCDRRSDDSAVGWEKLSPMVLRVLLVEADDSTRQIIAALLRKCGYRVAAVHNGLKAWEVLKARPNEIDLILTEVDLPSVSGYALLSLIMDHEICKNIPVIMMSTEDSVLTVYKCMLRGAADYLIKPIRRNELGNLWQHVWRRQTSLGRGIGVKDKDCFQDKLEPACKNNAASKRSSGDGAFSQRNKECAEKGSDTQSSCMVVDVDAVDSENVEDQPAAACKDVNGMAVDNVFSNVDTESKACDGNNANFTGEEFDFMGAAPLLMSSSAHLKSEFDSYGLLDLSLRSSFRGGFEIQPAEGKNSLRHSIASSFTRYTGKQLYLQHSESATVSNPKELAADSDRNFSGATGSGAGSISLPVVQVEESETENAIHQQNVLRTQDLVCGMRTNDIKNSASSSMFPLFQCEQSVHASPPRSLSSPNRLEASDNSSHASDSTTNEMPVNQDKRSDSSEEDQGHSTVPIVDRSSSSSLCDGGGASNNNSTGGYGSACGSNSYVDQVAIVKAETESNNNEGGGAGFFKSSTRSVQREAALAKFRLKRKERCFDKKVRYESRKMLAEQRPRVKGQFVRQVPAAALPLVSEQ